MHPSPSPSPCPCHRNPVWSSGPSTRLSVLISLPYGISQSILVSVNLYPGVILILIIHLYVSQLYCNPFQSLFPIRHTPHPISHTYCYASIAIHIHIICMPTHCHCHVMSCHAMSQSNASLPRSTMCSMLSVALCPIPIPFRMFIRTIPYQTPIESSSLPCHVISSPSLPGIIHICTIHPRTI